MLGKIKYFFWSTMISGLVLMASAVSPQLRSRLNSIMHMVKQKTSQTAQTLPEPIAEKIAEVTATSPNALPVVSEVDASKQVSASKNEYLIDDESYVLINGKYYKARADNTYTIDGQKVYFVNNRKMDEVNVQRAMAKSLEDSGAGYQTGEIPTNPTELIDTLKKAQESLNKRNQELNSIDYNQ